MVEDARLWHTAGVETRHHRRPAKPGGPGCRLICCGPDALVPDMSCTDEELVDRSRGGDPDSFNQLIVRWERPIYALAYRVIGREEDARDVCQEAFLRAYRALPGFKGEAKFSSWLYRITLNLCRDWIRRQRRAPVTQMPEDVDLLEVAAAAGPRESIEDLVARRELSAVVEEAMTLLPPEQRTAIVLKEYHGMTFQEIADLQGCPLSTVKTRLYQGLSVLRRHLERQGQMQPEMVTPRLRSGS
jgi:RNA polymerase sigma-70 factor (ECF subfamily)